MSLVDEIRLRLDIVEVVGAVVPLQKSGRSFRGRCPFHTERTPSFFVFPESQRWHCFGACATGGDVFSFVMRQQNLSFGEALRLLASQAGVALPEGPAPRGERPEQDRERLLAALAAATQFYHYQLLSAPAAEGARRHLQERGLHRETWERFALGYSPDRWDALAQHLQVQGFTVEELEQAGLVLGSDAGRVHDRFRGRLMVPIRDVRGRTVGFGARALDGSEPKYLNSPQGPLFEKGRLLYGLDLAAEAIRREGYAVLVEGYMDALMAHQQGQTNTVATMGTSLTEAQVRLLKRYTKTLVLALDADAAGELATQRGAELLTEVLKVSEPVLGAVPRSYEQLRQGFRMRSVLDGEVRVLTLPEGEDPDDVLRRDVGLWRRLVAEAQPLVDYLIETTLRGVDLSRPDVKEEATGRLLRVILYIPSTVQQAHYIQRLARRVGLPEQVVYERARELKRSYRGRAERVSIGARPSPTVGRAVEEHCLALLLQEPSLRSHASGLRPEYFRYAETQALYRSLIADGAGDAIQDEPALQQLMEELRGRALPPAMEGNRIAEFAACVRRLEEQWLRDQEQAIALLLDAVEEGRRGGDPAETQRWTELHEQALRIGERLRHIWHERQRAEQMEPAVEWRG